MVSPEPLISIIIPSYNYSKVLPRAVKSVLSQKTEKHELIVINDGSTDDSLRHQINHAKSGGISLVDEVFSPQRMGSEFQILKSEFYVKRCLSLEAFRKDWKVLLKGTYMRKALRLWMWM